MLIVTPGSLNKSDWQLEYQAISMVEV